MYLTKQQALSALKEPKIETGYDAENLLIGCLQLISRPATEWIDRKKGRRKALREMRLNFTQQRCQKALRDLVTLTKSEVEASWKTEF